MSLPDFRTINSTLNLGGSKTVKDLLVSVAAGGGNSYGKTMNLAGWMKPGRLDEYRYILPTFIYHKNPIIQVGKCHIYGMGSMGLVYLPTT